MLKKVKGSPLKGQPENKLHKRGRCFMEKMLAHLHNLSLYLPKVKRMINPEWKIK
jgi:hypothetical protein